VVAIYQSCARAPDVHFPVVERFHWVRALGAGIVSTHHSIPGPPEPPGHGRPDFASYGPPEPPRPGIGVDLRNLIILVMIVAVIFGVVRQCHHTTPEPETKPPSAEKQLAPETPQVEQPQAGQPQAGQPQVGQPQVGQPQVGQLQAKQPQAKHMASCRTAAERMDKNGALPRDYSINCPYWQWWTHNSEPARTPVPPDSARTQVRPAPEPPRLHLFADPGPPPREKDALRVWRYPGDRNWCWRQF
jgi:hypothetical protein